MGYRAITDELKSNQYEYSSDLLTRRGRMLFLRGLIIGYPPSPTNEGRDDAFSSVNVADDIMSLSIENPEKPIFLFIDSIGGEATNGFMLYDVIRMSKAPIYTIGINASSMATTILVSGNKRYVTPHSKTMIHLPSTMFQGDSSEMEIRNKEIAKVKEELVNIYIEHGATAGLKNGATHKQIKNKLMKDINKEKWFSAQEAVDYGLVDEIITPEILYGNIE